MISALNTPIDRELSLPTCSISRLGSRSRKEALEFFLQLRAEARTQTPFPSRLSRHREINLISEEAIRCDLRDRGSRPMQIQTEPADPDRYSQLLPLSREPQRRAQLCLSMDTAQIPSAQGRQNQRRCQTWRDARLAHRKFQDQVSRRRTFLPALGHRSRAQPPRIAPEFPS